MAARVLIIDDDPHLLSAMRRRLGDLFDLDTALSGRDGIAAAKAAEEAEIPFAVVLCDMRMPDLDGIQTLEAIRAIAPDTTRIMLTGNADQQTAIQAINRDSIFRFFTKPCEHAVLTDGIDAGIRQNQLLRAERLLAENEERWRLALTAVGDGVWDWAPLGGTMLFSDGWSRMLGYRDNELPTQYADWMTLIHPEDRDAVAMEFDRHLRGEIPVLFAECRLRCRNGAFKWLLVRGTALERNGPGQPLRVIGTGTDISQHKSMEETLRRQSEELRLLATTDPLTGLWNRRCFMEKAEQELLLIARHWRPLSVVMIDIDFFKRVNDGFGHDAGDAVLRHLALLLRNTIRRTDVIGRLGGEEFALLLPATTASQAMVVAETLRRKIAVSAATLPDGTSMTVTASMGVVDNADRTDSISRLLHDADLALYDAKNSGRNRVVMRSAPPVDTP